VINLDVVTRYYGFVKQSLSCDSAFYHTGWYYEYRETFRHGLTVRWRLHIAMDCGRGSFVKLCGLRRVEFFDLHTSGDCTPRRNRNGIVSLRPVLLATHIVVSWNREDVEWAKYKSNNLGGIWCDCCDFDTELKLVLWCYLHVMDGVVVPCCRQAVYSGPLGWHQMTVLEIIIAVLHRLCVCATVAVNSVCQWATQ